MRPSARGADSSLRRRPISAANIIARYIDRYRRIALIGLPVIIHVAGKTIYEGFGDHEVGVLRYIGA